jgi:hypothetical protein
MQLTYRGVNYNTNSAQSQAATPVVPTANLKYRGATYRWNQEAKAESFNAILKYRGAAYNPAPTGEAVEASEVAPASSIAQKARLLSVDNHRLVRNRQRSVLLRSAAELGLTVDNLSYWNHIQGKIPSVSWQAYDRSCAALS